MQGDDELLQHLQAGSHRAPEGRKHTIALIARAVHYNLIHENLVHKRELPVVMDMSDWLTRFLPGVLLGVALKWLADQQQV